MLGGRDDGKIVIREEESVGGGRSSFGLTIVDPTVERNELGGGLLVGTVEIDRPLPDNVTIHGLKLDLTVRETTAVCLIQKQHNISYQLRGEAFALIASFQQTPPSEGWSGTSRRIPFSADLSPKEIAKLCRMVPYAQEDTLCHDECSTIVGYCSASDRGRRADPFTTGSCEIKTVLHATLAVCGTADDTGDGARWDQIIGYGVVLLNNDPGILGSNTNRLDLSVVVRESAPAPVFCGLWEMPRPQTFSLERRDDHKTLCWSPQNDLGVLVNDKNSLGGGYGEPATETVVKLTQRISWSAKSKDLLHYVEYHNKSITIRKPVVHCSRPKSLIVEDQFIYWQYPLRSVDWGSVPFPRSKRIRSTYQGKSIEVYHQLMICIFGTNGRLLATSQPFPIVIRT